MASNFNKVITLAVALIIVAVIYPIALGLIANSENVVIAGSNSTVNGTNRTLGELIDPTVLTLLVTLLPIIAIIAVIMMFLPKSKAA